jgi:hypothetical protein
MHRNEAIMAAIKPIKPGTAGLPVGDKPIATTTRTTRRLAANANPTTRVTG